MGMRGQLAIASACLSLTTALLAFVIATTGIDAPPLLHDSSIKTQSLGVLCIAALAFAFILRNHHRLALGLAVAIGLIGALIFVEYVFSTSLGIDRLLAILDPAGTPEPGRVAPVTAAALMLAALAVALSAPPGRTLGRRAIWAQAAGGVAGLLILYGFADGLIVQPPEVLHPIARVPPQSAIPMLLLALAIQLRCSTIPPGARLPLLDRVAAWTTTLLCAAVILFWQALERNEWQNRSADSGIALTMVAEKLTAELEQRGFAIQHLARRWDTYGPPTQAQWEGDVSALQENFSNLHAITMIEPDLTIRWRVSIDGTGQEIVGTSVGTDGGRAEAYQRARETLTPQLTPGLELRSGGYGISYVAAIYESDRFRGYVATSIRADEILDIASDMIRGQFGATLADANQTIAGDANGLPRGSAMLRREREIDVLGQTFTLSVWPLPDYLDARRSYLPRSVLLLGLLTVALITLATLQARRGLISKQRADALANQLAGTLEHISDGFMMLDRDWRITYWNGNAAQISGVPVEKAVGSFPWESFPRADGRFADRYRQAQRDGQSAHFTDYFPPLDRYLEVHAHPVPDGMAVYFRDVTDERRRDEQLRLLESAVSRQNDIVIVAEAARKPATAQPSIIYVNAAFSRLTGHAEAEALGATTALLYGVNTRPEQIGKIEGAIAAAEPVRAELLTSSRSGEELWLDLDIVPLTDEQGQPTHWITVARDVTERHRAEQALAASEERFRLAARATRDVLWDWDLAQDTIWWSEAFTETFGESPKDSGVAAPGTWALRAHPDDQYLIDTSLREVIEGGGETWTAEYRAQHADGTYRSVVDHAFVMRDDQGHAIRVIGSLTDVTAQRDLESRIRQSQKMEAVGQLTGGVAHDFNNLLTVILGNAEQLDHALTDREDLRMLARMTARAAERGAELTGRLLAFARRQALQPRPTDVNQLLTGMEGLLNRSLTEQTDLKLSLDSKLWPAEIDPGQLEVALLNLTINARDAMPGGGCLTIETANAELDDTYADTGIEVPPGPYVMISVTDTGEGMAADVVARAFEPFFTTKDVGKGSGLGLSMVYGFVKQSGGHAKIYSEPGHGTTIRLYFPRSQPTERDTPPPSRTDDEVSPGRERVLVVEDDRLVREHAMALLTGLGYHVTGAENGSEALEILTRSDEFDLLFTDVVMPGGIDGRQLADAAREIRPNLKVLFTSGYAESAIVHHGRLDAGVQLLSKPYRRQELAAKVREVLTA